MKPGDETVRWLSFSSKVRVNSIRLNGKDVQGNPKVGIISHTGIGILMPANLRPKDVIDLNFTLPDSEESLQMKAVLKSRTGFRYWFEFVDVTTEQISKISRACAPNTQENAG
jgi:hypothetical protein